MSEKSKIAFIENDSVKVQDFLSKSSDNFSVYVFENGFKFYDWINNGGEINAIPIVAYHNIQDANLRGSTGVGLFSEEMKYLHDNNFRVIRVSDLGFNQTTNNLYVKGL